MFEAIADRRNQQDENGICVGEKITELELI